MTTSPRSRARFVVPAIIVVFIWSLTTHGKYSDSGDEPHYLMVAESLVTDHDIDVENNYRDGDGRWFGASARDPELHAARNRYGALWPTHDIGLPILLTPVYYVATRLAALAPEDTLARFKQTRGLFAYSLISLTILALVAWVATLLMSGLQRVANEGASIAVALTLVLSPPVLGHAFLVFPETIAFVITCAVVWLICQDHEALTRGPVLAVVAAVGFSPWLHRKFSFLALGLLFLIVRRHWRWIVIQPRGVLAALAALAFLPQIGLHLWTLTYWGNLGGPQMIGGLPFEPAGMVRGGLGLLFDRERGLLGYAPIYLIVPACFALTWKATRRLLVPILILFIPMSAYVVWWSGFAPAARYLVPLTPLVALPVALALDRVAIRRLAWVLVAFQAAITFYLWAHPRALWPKELGTNDALEGIPLIGPLYERALPSLATGDPLIRGWLVVGVIAIVTIAIVLTSVKQILRSQQTPTRLRS